MCFILFIQFFWDLFSLARGRGVLLLYQPLDISKDCAFSQRLRYDVTYGMGMSDTKTLVLQLCSKPNFKDFKFENKLSVLKQTRKWQKCLDSIY